MTEFIHAIEDEEEGKIVSAASSRRAAKWFNYGTLVAILVPLPLAIFWTGMSMLIYALNKHHPNPKVGHYTQRAAYRFYGVAGTALAVSVFFPVNIKYYLVIWAIAATVLIPWTIYDLYRINHDTWFDCVIEPHQPFEDDQ